MISLPSKSDLPLPTSAEVARKIYENSRESKLLRQLHRTLVQLEEEQRRSNALPDGVEDAPHAK